MFCNTPTVGRLFNQFLGAINLLQKWAASAFHFVQTSLRHSAGHLEERCAAYLFINRSEIKDCVCECVCVEEVGLVC